MLICVPSKLICVPSKLSLSAPPPPLPQFIFPYWLAPRVLTQASADTYIYTGDDAHSETVETVETVAIEPGLGKFDEIRCVPWVGPVAVVDEARVGRGARVYILARRS